MLKLGATNISFKNSSRSTTPCSLMRLSLSFGNGSRSIHWKCTVVSCELVGRSGKGIDAVGGEDLEAIVVLQTMERIWPFKKRAVYTLSGKVSWSGSSNGMGAFRLFGSRSGSARSAS